MEKKKISGKFKVCQTDTTDGGLFTDNSANDEH